MELQLTRHEVEILEAAFGLALRGLESLKQGNDDDNNEKMLQLSVEIQALREKVETIFINDAS